MSIVVIDFGMSNLGSVRRSLKECGARVVIADHPAALKQVSRAALPGVGAFARGMEGLRARGWVPTIRESALEDGIRFLGASLGKQLLADTGHEGGTPPASA
jgi:glutamine amidotransferase